MFDAATKDAEVKENVNHYVNIFKSAFLFEELPDDSAATKKSYEKRGYKVASIKFDEGRHYLWAIKKRPIVRVTDLTYENGGGWDSLSQSVQDIIQSGFDISTTTLPKDRLHKKGGMYEKKVEDGFEVLEVSKGGWVEAIFAKLKPEQEKPKMQFKSSESDEDLEDDDADVVVEDNYSSHDEVDDEVEDPNDEELTEENYSTMMDLGSEDPDDEAANLIDFSDE